MNLKDIVNALGDVGLGNLAVIVFLLFSLIQIAPIKVDPWSHLIRWIGKIMNKDVMDEIKSIKEDLANVHDEIDKSKKESDKREADAARNRILRFDDELRRKVDHSEEFFNQILEDINAYLHYCDEHKDYKNSRADGAIEHIKDTYNLCKEKNSFI